jgi:hypothetical protein
MKSRRGRAHLERLLDKTEKVVRLTPADVIVLIGLPDFEKADPERLMQAFEDQGIEARGLIALEPGMDIDSIDLAELVRLDSFADEVDEGGMLAARTVVSSPCTEDLTVSVRCPRCTDLLQMTVTASVSDTGDRLVGSTTVDSRDMELHAILCKGKKPTSE